MRKQATHFAAAVFCIVCIGAPFDAAAAPSAREAARLLFERLSGSPLNDNDPRLTEMETLISAGKLLEAAKIATADAAFLTDTVRVWAAPMSNKNRSSFVPLNDFIATVMGVVRDRKDARTLLTGDFRYHLTGYGNPETRPEDYLLAERRFADIRQLLVSRSPQFADIPVAAGLLTTRTWAAEHLEAGTNRRAIRYALEEFLCRPIESVMTFSIPDNWVRRDVDRRPGGVHETYQTRCVGCHSGMDALAGAYAYFDYSNGQVRYSAPTVQPKNNQNRTVFPSGHVVVDDSWENLWGKHRTLAIDWRAPLKGSGITQLGQMIASSDAFSQCMTKRVAQSICGMGEDDTYASQIASVASDFESNGYDLDYLFRKVAVQPWCIFSMEK